MHSLRRLYRRMLLVDRWFECTALGRLVAVATLSLLAFEILFLGLLQ